MSNYRKGVLAALLLLLGSSCERQSVARTGSPARRESAEPSATSVPPASAPVVAAEPAGPPPSASPHALEAASPPTQEPPGSTRGTVACGATRCRSGAEVCALSPSEHCVAVGSYEEGRGGLFCDDSSDCASGLACCQAAASSELVQLCTPRDGAKSQCVVEVCKPDGARCARGWHCEAEACQSDRATSCPGSAQERCGPLEYCQWDGEKARCNAEPNEIVEPHGPNAVFACTKPSDCKAGWSCCTSSLVGYKQTRCAKTCDFGLNEAICSRTSECQALLATYPPEARRGVKTSCEPVGEAAPPWLRRCTGLP